MFSTKTMPKRTCNFTYDVWWYYEMQCFHWNFMAYKSKSAFTYNSFYYKNVPYITQFFQTLKTHSSIMPIFFLKTTMVTMTCMIQKGVQLDTMSIMNALSMDPSNLFTPSYMIDQKCYEVNKIITFLYNGFVVSIPLKIFMHWVIT